MDEVRIDKWMRVTHIFKTRTVAVEACKKGRITIGGITIKPPRMVKVGDVIQVRKPLITFSFKITGLIENRVSTKLAPNYLEDVAAPDQYEILEMNRISGFVNRVKGLGHPTKKDRREPEQFTEPEFMGDGFDLEFGFGEEDEE